MAYLEYQSNATAMNVRRFRKAFGGDIYFAVKANPTPEIVEDLLEGGITGFDVASVEEIALVRKLSRNIPVIYTHPVKRRDEIAEAFWTWGVRSFAVDSIQELRKINDICAASELEIFVRIKSGEGAEFAKQNLDEKFGASPEAATKILKAVHELGAIPSIAFHVGSQQMSAGSHLQATARIADALDLQQVRVNRISIGGGFPASYSLADELAEADYVPSVSKLQRSHRSLRDTTFVAEPGRVLVANTMDLVVEVLLVEGDRVFIDDGIYTTLLDSVLANMLFPISAETRGKSPVSAPFRIFGRTCDSLDRLPGTYDLPRDLEEGDRLRVHCVGAYGTCLTRNFNGLSAPPKLRRLPHGSVAASSQGPERSKCHAG